VFKKTNSTPPWLIAYTLCASAFFVSACSPGSNPGASHASASESLQTSVQAANPATLSRYTEGTANYDGIGRIYMGREISHVMGHQGAGWLERPSREREERTDLLIQNLPLSPDDTVVDLGAGTGYFSLRMAQRVLGGKVLAVDLQPEMLNLIKRAAAESAINNVRPVLATETNPNLPANSVNLVLLVDAYHEFNYPWEVMTAVYESLRPGGKVVLVEYRAEDRSVPIKRLHKMTEAQSIKEMQAVGLQWVETLSVLPQQHMMIFTKPAVN